MIASAGIYALENNIERLSKDHKRARRLAEALNEMPAFSIDLDTVQSNIVFIGTGKGNTKETIAGLSKKGVEILEIDDSTIRAVFHLHITDEDLERAIDAFEQL